MSADRLSLEKAVFAYATRQNREDAAMYSKKFDDRKKEVETQIAKLEENHRITQRRLPNLGPKKRDLKEIDKKLQERKQAKIEFLWSTLLAEFGSALPCTKRGRYSSLNPLTHGLLQDLCDGNAVAYGRLNGQKEIQEIPRHAWGGEWEIHAKANYVRGGVGNIEIHDVTICPRPQRARRAGNRQTKKDALSGWLREKYPSRPSLTVDELMLAIQREAAPIGRFSRRTLETAIREVYSQ